MFKNVLNVLSGPSTSSQNQSKLDAFWQSKLRLTTEPIWNFDGKREDELYQIQAGHLASAILIADYDAGVQVDQYVVTFQDKMIWPCRGELISGSFISRAVTESAYGGVSFEAEDIDIYFHTKEDAKEFLSLNAMSQYFNMENPICGYGTFSDIKYNLIWGIEYKSPEHLISRFDIRACAMAIDPTQKILYTVRGALDDCTNKQIVFNPVPRGVSVRRLIKYVEKGFEIEPHQRLFFAELVRSDLYSTELELITARY